MFLVRKMTGGLKGSRSKANLLPPEVLAAAEKEEEEEEDVHNFPVGNNEELVSSSTLETPKQESITRASSQSINGEEEEVDAVLNFNDDEEAPVVVEEQVVVVENPMDLLRRLHDGEDDEFSVRELYSILGKMALAEDANAVIPPTPTKLLTPVEQDDVCKLEWNNNTMDSVLPNFARIPTPKHAWSLAKTQQYDHHWDGKQALKFATKHILNGGSDLCHVDFTLLATSTCESAAMQHIAQHHSTDSEFARMFVESLFCTQVHALHLDATSGGMVDWVRQLQVKHDEDQRFCYVDYPGDNNAVRCLFELRPNNNGVEVLFPVAIGISSSSYLPQAAGWDAAKLVVKHRAGQHHQAKLLVNKFTVEPFAVALETTELPKDHLLVRMLQVHFRNTVDANFKTRAATSSTALPLVEHYFASFQTEDMCLPVQLTKRGFQTWDIPECCVYFKDALRLWKALEQFCTHCVFETYASEKDLTLDQSLHEYFVQVQHSGRIRIDVPSKRTELARTLCGIIFTCTVEHAALSFPQFSHYGFVANSPLSMMPIVNVDDENELVMADYLPNPVQAALQIASAFTASKLLANEDILLFAETSFFNDLLWKDFKYCKYCEELQFEMKKIEANIRLRPNTGYGTRYEWLLPSSIPVSIGL